MKEQFTGIQIHRFREKVAISFLTSGIETLYLDADTARSLARLLKECGEDIGCFDFQRSKFKTTVIDRDDV